MWNAGLVESQTGIKIAGRNNQQLQKSRWYHSDRKQRTKKFLDEVKEESEEAGLKPNIHKMKRKESDHNTKENNQITKEDSKRSEPRTTKQSENKW